MSGHNKWSKIKRQKEKTDAQKSKIFGKLVRMISVEAKKSSGNIDSPALRSAIEKARSMNVPNDSIDRAIKKAGDGTDNMEKIVYEAYGPGGVAIIIEALTSNRNKAAQEIKHILSKHDLSLATMGSATWAFENTSDGWQAKTSIDISENDTNILENLIDELEENDEVQEVFTNAL
ncbi:MAG: YebC/PmpR family DNA-binding transcriptional regulator [Candidatus Zambryskibacteria bacterium CG_4_9_14_3_um_filter_40_16]|uniref:YebC/PmpR family DNA-binding transcriptional regulator n=2 Tax=Candidatus Zambryskiibacteriota TaxID=1817925 RepID=A0A2H0K710_9BACT|nr:MAG: YebC/PmpR family DNA-binding transcriptional regulator [Candidatus Zambryskibacteria bacterium CG11_big_fil_rev_8_21_14_0_20_40_24]PJA33431.1 MAG: YebC/PmpR family DNA-binding transcriptional regulator [Candidatus Zambryskibacteria bacterium CG_4_9_14_3_um_filter_40_16]